MVTEYDYPPNDVPAFCFWLMPDEDPLYEEWPNELRAWHRGRCAMCQVTDWYDNSLVLDHDHDTGKIRGYLCRGCNSSEGHGNDSPQMAAWRAGLTPAAVLGIDELYISPFTGRPVIRPPAADPDTMRRGAEAAGRIG
jgi:hypothetical protein